ncbi:MAG: type 1 glutamine amidotransferase [Sideroxydans sp.]|nr:type 1 glutamine amidotransferase [Sideroxydans sp.]
MKPVAVFRHSTNEGPGHIALFLTQHAIPWQMFHIDKGEDVPGNAEEFSGLVFMGGVMSVNDDLPWIPKTLELIRAAMAKDIPVLGHCLGGQLMSKALGGVVSKNPVKELGWGEVTVSDNETARQWFGDVKKFDSFHWHGETFSLPPDAVHLLSSTHCENQAFAIGKHLGMQCHVEMTEHMIEDWCEAGAADLAANSASPGVQSAATMQAQMHDKLPRLNKVAEQLYLHWIHGIAPRAS